MTTLVECVPNFSEGGDQVKIDKIVDAIQTVNGITLLDVDLGKETNRTVVTFVGDIKSVEMAAFLAIKTASEVIDMSIHEGAHPRMGATDVCPFIPVSNVTIDDCIALSERVGERVGKELSIPVYLYEKSAKKSDRVNLATIRQGEYEGLSEKLRNPHWAPDYGPAEINRRAGATVMGCREFLIAYNINLNTRDSRLATDIAFELREKGRSKRIPHSESNNLLDGTLLRYAENSYPCSFCDTVCNSIDDLLRHGLANHGYDHHDIWSQHGYDEKELIGKAVKTPGLFKNVKAIGWYIDTFNRAQISINFTNYNESTIHEVFDKTSELAEVRGVRVTGSELVGLIPKKALVMAGKYYLIKQNRSTGIPEKDIIETAVQSLGLNDLTPFILKEKIIDYAVESESNNPLINMTVEDFISECSRNSVAPGGGSVAALCTGMGSALISMVAALTHEKKGYYQKKTTLNKIGNDAQEKMYRLKILVDEDTQAFNQIILADRLPDKSNEEKSAREKKILTANKYAAEIPLEVAEIGLSVLKLAQIMVTEGNPNSVSDIGVAAEAALAGVRGAALNVLINLNGINDDHTYTDQMKTKIQKITDSAEAIYKQVHQQTLEIIFPL